MHTGARCRKEYHAQYYERKKTWPENKHLRKYKFQVHSCSIVSIITTAVASNAQVYVSSEEFA
jgi:hypothetical protein